MSLYSITHQAGAVWSDQLQHHAPKVVVVLLGMNNGWKTRRAYLMNDPSVVEQLCSSGRLDNTKKGTQQNIKYNSNKICTQFETCPHGVHSITG